MFTVREDARAAQSVSAGPDGTLGEIQAAIAVIESRLATIQVENPHVDRERIRRAVADHLRALGLGSRRVVWARSAREAHAANSGIDVWAEPPSPDVKTGPAGLASRNAWMARMGLCFRWDIRGRLGPDQLAESPGAAQLARSRRWLASMDRRLHHYDLLRYGRRCSVTLTSHLDEACRLLRLLERSPQSWHVWGPGEQRWWPLGFPSRAVTSAFVHLAEAASAGLLSIWNHGSICVLLLARPQVHLEDGRLHRWDGGPAVVWPGGRRHYFWRGVRMRAAIGAHPENLSPRRFLTWRNAEARRVAIERYGFGRLVEDGLATRVKADPCGVLWRLKLPSGDAQFVEVKDATPQPDGTHKTYYLCVPPRQKTPRAAVAWTFGFERVRDYRPAVET